MAKKPSRLIKLFGTEVPDGKRRIVSAGPLSATFDSGALRYISWNGLEVLRGIAWLSRDRNWGTYSPAIENLKIRQSKDAFTISYSATCKDGEQSLKFDAKIEASAKGTLRFSATGIPLTDYLTCRTGFVVLHPLDGVAGRPVEVIHTDGKKEKASFPKLISPGQPIFEIRQMKHEPVPGLSVTVLMEGNKFEMEDHRNWMDASYKTYVCSLLDPWPYTLKKGEPFTQSITLAIAGKPAKPSGRRASGKIEVELGGAKNAIPRIGAAVSMAEAQHAVAAGPLVSLANPAELICQIDGRLDGQAAAAEAFRALAERTGRQVKLEIILPAQLGAASEVDAIAQTVHGAGLKPESVVVTQAHDLKSFQPGAQRPWGPSYEEMATAVRASFPGVKVGGGMLSYFTELNRKPVPQGVFDFITHTGCPIVHAADDVSVMETLESLPWIFASTRAMIGKTPYHIGPTSIPCRDNPYGRAAAPNPGNGRVCLSTIDPRQRGLYAAAWNLGYLARAAEAGLDAVALGSLTGPQGIIYRKGDEAQPWFDEGMGRIYPAYHIMAGLAPASGMKRMATQSSSPAKVAALAHKSKRGTVLWLANLIAEKQSVKVKGLAGVTSLHVLDAGSFEAACKSPAWLTAKGETLRKVGSVELEPYAVARFLPL